MPVIPAFERRRQDNYEFKSTWETSQDSVPKSEKLQRAGDIISVQALGSIPTTIKKKQNKEETKDQHYSNVITQRKGCLTLGI